MSVIEGRLRDKYMGTVPSNTNFASFYQEPKEIQTPDGTMLIPRMAVFAIISDHPKMPRAPRIMTHGTTTAQDFEDSCAEAKHMVGRHDPARAIFASVLKHHMETLTNLRDIIH